MKSFSEIMGEANDISCLIKLSQRFINDGQFNPRLCTDNQSIQNY